ncbi:MAG: hypothetical protein COA92_00100 [Sulfurovum sp.]|nr:MAG: hypothetical protein COA92_00100 [Sulfurovum sp.]
MVWKDIDSKDNELDTLKQLFKNTSSEKQRSLIKQDLVSLENGYESEKENAYYLNFHFEDKKRTILLHDIRLEHNGRTAQFDHILIAPIGITLLESKSFKGKLTIGDDNSLNVNYGKYIKTFPNPIEQNNRHEKVLKGFIGDKIKLSTRFKLMGGIPIDNVVIIHPNTTLTNKKLPNGFERSDAFATQWNKNIDNMSATTVLLKSITLMSLDMVKDIAKSLVALHKPIIFDYAKKYRISKQNAKTFVEEKAENTKQTLDNKFCPRCKEGELVKRKRKSKKFGQQYASDEFYGCNRFPKCKYTEEI